jgi:hypothetical protein
MTRLAEKIAIALIVLAVLNFLAFAVSTEMLKGDAVSGKVEDGHFYVAYKGEYTEVSEAAWHYSMIQTISVFVTWPIGMLGMGYFGISRWAAMRNGKPAIDS